MSTGLQPTAQGLGWSPVLMGAWNTNKEMRLSDRLQILQLRNYISFLMLNRNSILK